MTQRHRAPSTAGVGLRLPHLAEVAAASPRAAWFEIHPENFLANPHARELLLSIAERYPLSVHTVGVSIGSIGGIDRAHLMRVKSLIDDLDPVRVSGHLAWSTHEGEYLNDLLPLPYDDETLDLLVRHLDEVQTALKREYLVENPSSYVGFGHSTMSEAEFLSELVARTGCKLLCDVSNVHLSAHNLNYDAHAYLDALPRDAIAELHLGGFSAEEEDGDRVIVDTHGRRIADEVWPLYAHAACLFPHAPTLIEWDNDLPELETLLAEAATADRVRQSALGESRLALAG